jgi:hypothetical protein
LKNLKGKLIYPPFAAGDRFGCNAEWIFFLEYVQAQVVDDGQGTPQTGFSVDGKAGRVSLPHMRNPYFAPADPML